MVKVAQIAIPKFSTLTRTFYQNHGSYMDLEDLKYATHGVENTAKKKKKR